MKKIAVIFLLIFGLSIASYAVKITLRNALQSPIQVTVRQKGTVIWRGRIPANSNASFNSNSGTLHIRYLRTNGTTGVMTPSVFGLFMLYVLL